MSEPFVFDSRCTYCKEPYGAVTCGTEISFRCRPLSSAGFVRCTLEAHLEFAQKPLEFPMPSAGIEGERTCFSVTITAPEEPDLMWYAFRLYKPDGSTVCLDRNGYCQVSSAPWQQTVYLPSRYPKWFGRGVTYQIFPDRFFVSGKPVDPKGLLGNRWLHEKWGEQPAWQPDPDGEIRNRDFFGGNLKGITEKLDYLKTLGVTTIYMCPIFESASNHRYNTGDYGKVDPMLGTEEDFRILCAEAKERGMYIVLDGVFNHIGSQSLYFNVDGYYSTLGAGQSKESPYYDWFRFKSWPNEYDSWWGFKTLPAVEETNKDYVNYIMDGEDSIVRRWLRAGASGWRLDVADELPDEFIAKIRSAMEETKEDTLLIGEVWDDGTTKIAYDQRRKYLLGSETHGLMNYPLRTALLNYLRGGDADEFREAVETLRENYPKEAFYSCMNLLGTHDTPRLLTMLGSDQLPKERKDQAAFKLSPQQRSTALALLRCAETILYAFPGSPMLYYGDEAGMEGCQDPFNRGCYPWGKEDHRLLSFFRRLGELRNQEACLQDGELHWLFTSGPLLAFAREKGDRRIVTAVNRDAWRHTLTIPWKEKTARDLISGKEFEAKDGFVELILEARGAMMLA